MSLGYYKPKTPSSSTAYIEVPKDLQTQIKDIVKGKVLKTTREAQIGHATHSTRLAALAAHNANITSKEQFKKDSRTVRRQNAANHGSPLSRPKWADMFDDFEQIVTTNNLKSTLNMILDNWTVTNPSKIPNFPGMQQTIGLIRSSPPSPPFSYRSNSSNSPTETPENQSFRPRPSQCPQSPKPPDLELPEVHPTPLLPPDFGKHQTSYEAIFDQIFNINGREEIIKHFQDCITDADDYEENHQPTRAEFERANLSDDERGNEEFMLQYRAVTSFHDDPPTGNYTEEPNCYLAPWTIDPNANPSGPTPNQNQTKHDSANLVQAAREPALTAKPCDTLAPVPPKIKESPWTASSVMADDDRSAIDDATEKNDPCRYGAAKFLDVMALDSADPTLFVTEEGTFTCANCTIIEQADTSFVCNYCGAHLCPDCVVAHSKACYSETLAPPEEYDHERWKKKYFCHFYEENRCRAGESCKYSHDPETKNPYPNKNRHKKAQPSDKDTVFYWCAAHGKRRGEEFLIYNEAEKSYRCRPKYICRGAHEVPDEDNPQAPSPKKLPTPATSIEKQVEATASTDKLPIDSIRPEEEHKAKKDAAKRQKKLEKKEKKEKDEVKREKSKKKKKTNKIKSEEQSDQTLPEEPTYSPSQSEGSVHAVKHDAKEEESYYSKSPSPQNSPRRSRSPQNRKSHNQERPTRQESVRHSSTKDKKDKSQKTLTVYRDRTVSEGFKTGPPTTCFRGHTASVCRMYSIPNYLLTCSKCDFDIKVNDVVSLCHSCDPTFISCLSCTVRRMKVITDRS
jgi:hypothetical protein